MTASSASKKSRRNISTGGERTQESLSMEPRSCWAELNLDILMKIFDGISFSDLSCNVSSVCCSWQLACWYILCWANKNNLLDLGVIRPALANAKFTSSRDRALMKLLKSVLDDNDIVGNIYLENWRLSIRTLLFPEDLEISDDHLIYVSRRTKGIDRLVLLGSSGITGRGFAKAICNWRNVNSVHIGKIRYRCFDQIVEEIGRNSTVLDFLTLSMRDFYLTCSAASVIGENLVRVKILRFEGVRVHRDGINRLFNDCLGMQEIQLCGCFLMEDDDLSILKAKINVNFGLRKRDGFQEWGFHNNVQEGTKHEWRNWLRRGITVPMMMKLNGTFEGLFSGGF